MSTAYSLYFIYKSLIFGVTNYRLIRFVSLISLLLLVRRSRKNNKILNVRSSSPFTSAVDCAAVWKLIFHRWTTWMILERRREKNAWQVLHLKSKFFTWFEYLHNIRSYFIDLGVLWETPIRTCNQIYLFFCC